MIIFKATPNKIGKKHGNKASVTYEIYHNLKDKWGNSYPKKNLVYITVLLTASSSALITLEYLDEVYFPEVGLDADGELLNNSGLVLYAFRGHYVKEVKAVTEPMEKLDWLLMDGGITPNAQPLDLLINKVFKDPTRQ